MRFNFTHILIAFAFFFSLSCSDSTEYAVETEFDEYLQRFLAEAAKRGKTFNLQASGIIMRFADLEGNIGGKCYHEKPVRIEFDRKYWKYISRTAYPDAAKESIVFHELGHGLLGREHRNERFSNGEMKSLMCESGYFVNFFGIRREYYIKELFASMTAAPDWVIKKIENPIETYYHEEIHDPRTITNTQTLPCLISMFFGGYFNQDDFYYEIRFRFEGEKIGLAHLSQYFYITADQRFTVGVDSYDPEEILYTCAEFPLNTIKHNAENSIGLKRKNRDLYYYVNGQCIYYDKADWNMEFIPINIMFPPFSSLTFTAYSYNDKQYWGE